MDKTSKAEITEIKKITDKIDGFLGSREGPLLYELAKKCSGRGVIVEIGSWRGKSTIWLGKGSMRGNAIKVYAIDPHTGSVEHREKYGEVWTFDQFKENMICAGIDDIIVPILGTSEDASTDFDQPVELIFIDGAHDYDSVKLDFGLWFPKVATGGTIVFHDWQWPGVKESIKELVLRSRDFSNVRVVKNTSLVVADKVRKNSVVDVLRNRYLILVMNLDFQSRFRRVKKKLRDFGKK